MPMKNPPHPGDLIGTEVIKALGLTVSKAAEILQVRRATLADLLHGKASLTPEMALRIEKAFGPVMDHLLRMQLAYDVSKTRAHARSISIRAICPGLKLRSPTVFHSYPVTSNLAPESELSDHGRGSDGRAHRNHPGPKLFVIYILTPKSFAVRILRGIFR